MITAVKSKVYRLGIRVSPGRDRKQAELDLQNARRKETREMARDLESQLAAVDRIAQVSFVPFLVDLGL